MMQKLLNDIKPETLIRDKNALIGIKPNLVVAREASSGATTHPELVEGVIVYLQEKGYQKHHHFGRLLGGRPHFSGV